MTLLHGFMQDRSSWSEVLQLLPEGWRWILVDLPGHGGSATEVATMAGAASGLVALWDHLGIERTHLAGYSMGGRLALYIAAVDRSRRPASLLTLGAHAGLAGAARTARLRDDLALAARVEKEGMDWFAEHWARQPLFAGIARRGPEVLARLDRMRRRQDARGIAASLRGMGAASVEPFWDALGSLQVPATFAAGMDDRRYAEHARRLQARVPGSRVELVPEAGHAAHIEQPAAFAGLLVRHLSTR